MNVIFKVIDTLPHGFLLIDCKGIVVESNKAILETLGFMKNEIKGIETDKLLSRAEDKKYIRDIFNSADLQISNKEVDLIFTKKNGRKSKMRMHTSIIKDNDEKFCALSVVDSFKNYLLLDKETESTSESMERRLAKTESLAKIGHWEWLLNPERISWSRGLYDLWGLSPSTEPPSIEDHAKWIHPEDQEKFYKTLEESLKNGESYTITFRALINNELKYIRGDGTPLRDESEKLIGFFGLAQDITDERKKNELLDLIVSSTMDGYWDWYLKDDYEYMSPRFWEIFGFSPEEKRHHPSEWQKLIHEDDLQIALKNFELHVKTKGEHPFYQEVRYRHKDGSEVWVVCKGKVVEWDKEGEPVRMVGTHTDITKEKQQQNSLRISNERYRLVTEGASVGIWDWPDIKSDKEIWSPRFYELLGYKEGEIEANLNTFAELLHPDDKEKTFALVQEHFERNVPFDLEYRLKIKGGSYKWFRGSGQVSRDKKGRPKRMVGSIQDIHEKVLAKNELKRSNEELDEFAYIASHDLREPLRGMRNFSQFLIEDYSDKLNEEGLNYLETIKKLGERLEIYLDSLLYYSRLGRGEMSIKRVDLNVFLESITETYINPMEGNIDIRVNGCLPQITCDYVKLQKIFGNLIQNSIRYNLSERKIVEIWHKKNEDSMHQFWIKDNGIGIKTDHWKRIFTIFKRLHPKEDFEGGTGLGLTLVKKAVERHGGQIWVESSIIDEGTIITFTIREQSPDEATQSE